MVNSRFEKVVFVFATAAICALVSGCSAASGPSRTEYAAEEVDSAEVAMSDDEIFGDVLMQGDISGDDETVQPDEAAVPFIFRDVFGVEYETVINPNVAPKRYSNDAFIKEGDTMSYLDGDYLLGIDVSHHQGDIDWDAVRADGYDFAILRIGYRGYGTTGSLNADKRFEEYYEGAKSAGLKVGVYFFAQAVNETEAKEEANLVLDILNGRELDLPVVYDPESILDDVARTDDVTGEQFTANTLVFCETVSTGGYEPMIYANMLWEAFELNLEELAEYPIWYADYEDKPQTPYDFKIWQYTNEGNVSGISGVCDLDIWIL